MIRKRFLSVLFLLTLLLAGAAGAGWRWVSHPFPPTSGTVQLRGLDGPVEIWRDRWGVPHIGATTIHDLYFAQGVVHAQDRLWQMEFQRRVGLGRLSEVLGERALGADRFIRTLGMAEAARQDWEALDGETQRVLRAYADGVNRYVATAKALPLEYQLLDLEWEPWEPLHTLALWKVMQWELSGNWEEELFQAALLNRVDEQTASLLMGDQLPRSPARYDMGSPDLAALRTDLNVASIGLSNAIGRGAHGWILGGDRTVSGRPLVANDLHLAPRMPSPWYLIELRTPEHRVAGASMPGSPAVVAGHNEEITWGPANLAFDTQDLYVERLNGARTHYEWEGEMVPLQRRHETIRVRNGKEVLLEVRETRHGPLLDDAVEGLNVPLSLRWRAIAEPSRMLAALLALNQASDRQSFLEALRQWDTPAQTFLYADRDGNIGHVAAGDLPIRSRAGGMLPQPGWIGEWEWQGTVPFDELPQLWNPPEGYIVAMDRVLFPDTLPYYTGASRSAGYRDKRVRHLIEEEGSLAIEDIAAIQRDVTSLPAQHLIPRLVAVESGNIVVQRAQAQLAGWNVQVEGALPGAGIYQVSHAFVVRNLLADLLQDQALVEQYLAFTPKHLRLVEKLLEEPDHPLWDDTTTPGSEGRDEILQRALHDTRHWLGRRFGDVPHEWFWERLHTLTFSHPLATRTPLDSLFSRRVEGMGGDGTTINTVGFSYGDRYAVDRVPAYRQIIDVGEWHNSRWLNATGQSGHPFHRHYDDMLERWQRVELLPMQWTDAPHDESTQTDLLRLEPLHVSP